MTKVKFDLNERQKLIVNYILSGLSNKAIGERLGIKEGSVKWNLTRIFAACEVKTRLELMALFINKKLN